MRRRRHTCLSTQRKVSIRGGLTERWSELTTLGDVDSRGHEPWTLTPNLTTVFARRDAAGSVLIRATEAFFTGVGRACEITNQGVKLSLMHVGPFGICGQCVKPPSMAGWGAKAGVILTSRHRDKFIHAAIIKGCLFI